MMLSLINSLVFASLMLSFIVHLKSRHSHSYILMAAYFVGCIAIIARISERNALIPYTPFWSAFLMLLGIGEYIRFRGLEKTISNKINMIRRKQGLHYHFEHFISNYSGGEKHIFHDGIHIIKTYETSLSCTLIFRAKTETTFDFIGEDFDTQIRVKKGAANFDPARIDNYFPALAPLNIHMTEGSTIEVVIRKRQ